MSPRSRCHSRSLTVLIAVWSITLVADAQQVPNFRTSPQPQVAVTQPSERTPLVPINQRGTNSADDYPSVAQTTNPRGQSPGGLNGNGLSEFRQRQDNGPLSLTGDAGQIWREYDISTFTRRLRDQTKPEQVIVDWILRETGTDAWFGDTMSVLSATPEMIRVYHTPKVHRIVERLMDRFLNSRSEQNEVAVRLVTINSPNWRARALPVMTPVKTQTPGIEAWILSRENAALLLNELNRRPDYQEHNSPNLTIYNGQTHLLKSTRPRLYTTYSGASDSRWGGNVDQVDEGFSLQISPLVGADNRSIEAVIKCKVDQVEQMSPLRVSNVDSFGVMRHTQVQVPQLSSWQLHERFRWPVGDVLLVSRGVVATPGPTTNQGIGRVLGKAPRADALLFLESRSGFDNFRQRTSVAERTSSANYRGRY